ncbi:hypothetical protein ACNKHK_02085 [Shigella flexneri]
MAASASKGCQCVECEVAQEYTVEQLNHGREAGTLFAGTTGLSAFQVCCYCGHRGDGVRGFNWGLDFTGGTVIEITLEKPADMDVMRDALEKAGFVDPLLQDFGSSHDIMVRMPPTEGADGGQVLGSKVVV